MLSAATSWCQCDHEVSGVFYYCRPENPDSFFVAFRVNGGADTLHVIDLASNAPDNSGIAVDDIDTEEEPKVMGMIDPEVSFEPIVLTNAEPTEYRYFGPIANGSDFNIVVVDPDGVCDTISVLEGSYDCDGHMSGACDSDVPFYDVDFTGSPEDSFDIIQRTRVESCCDAGNSAHCFEIKITLADIHVGVVFEDIGSGASGGELLANYASGFMCEGSKASTWPFIQENGASAPTLCLSGGETYFIASCKPGGNSTGVTITGITGPRAPDLQTPETCENNLSVENAEQVSWSSVQDPGLVNLTCTTPDSLDCIFLYDTTAFGEVFNCDGDTFYYIASVMPEDIACVGDTMFSDTSMVIVYPVFTLDMDTICHDHPDSVSLRVMINGPASGCDYSYVWSNGDMTDMITVLADGSEYTATINRSDIDLDEACVPNAISGFAHDSKELTCSLNDTVVSCITEIPLSNNMLIEASGCAGDPVIFSVDRHSANSGCAGDTLTIERTYYIDFDRDLMTLSDLDSCVQLIQVVDTMDPTLVCLGDTAVSCSTDLSPSNLGEPQASDNCSMNISQLVFQDSTVSGSCSGDYTIYRSWEATDSCGNTATCIQLITVVDDMAPMINCPVSTSIGCEESSDPANTGMANAVDVCGGGIRSLAFEDTITGVSCTGIYKIERTWTATDSCDNSTSCVQVINVIDGDGPSVTPPSNITLSCESNLDDLNVTGMPMVTDNCDNDPDFNWQDDYSQLNGCGATGQIIRTFTASDDCGNTSSSTQVITIEDTTTFKIEITGDMALGCDVDLDTLTFNGNVAIGPCHQLDTTYSDDLSEYRCGGSGVIVRTWTISDTCGRERQADQNIVMTERECLACLDTIIMVPGDSCLDADVYEFLEVDRFEFCGNAQFTSISGNGGPCIHVTAVNPQNANHPNIDTSCILLCDTMNGVEYCDTTIVVVFYGPRPDTIVRFNPHGHVDTICMGDYLQWGLNYHQNVSITDFGRHSALVSDVNGDSCLIVENPVSSAGIDYAIMEHCYDTLGFTLCDTTNIILVTSPPSDTMIGQMGFRDTMIFCFDTVLQFEGAYTSMIMCGPPSHVDNGRLPRSNQDTCIQVMTSDDFAGLDTICMMHCYATPIQPVCDTTVILLVIAPARDTILVELGSEFCLEDPVYELSEVEVTEICDPGDDVTVTVINDSCFRLDPIDPNFSGSDTVCIVLCDTISGIELCDTTIAIVQQCPQNLACNDLIYLSLDENCEGSVTGDLIAEGGDDFANFLEITIFDESGERHENSFNGSDVGQRFTVVSSLSACGLTCWGEIVIEDKHIPQLLCADTTTIVNCGESTLPEDIGLPLPEFVSFDRVPGQDEFIVSGFDPCGDVWLSYYDEEVKNGCDDTFYYFITRTWTVKDAYGNETECTEEIGILPGSFDSLVFPPNFDGIEKFTLECDYQGIIQKSQPVGGFNIGWNFLPNGYPSPYNVPLFGQDTLIGTGFPTGTVCQNIGSTYRDQIIETCGNTYKLLRTWYVFDWCTGQDSTHLQTIKVVDTRAPQIICPPATPFIVPTDPWVCTATYLVPEPIFDPNFSGSPDRPVIIQECDGWSYKVKHKISSEGTLDPSDCAAVDEDDTFFTTNVRQRPDGRWEIFDMPQGCNWIKYIITDSCGNTVECGMELFVQDQQPPIAVCDEHTVVALNDRGLAELCATSIDNGSTDNCTDYEDLDFLIREMSEPDSLLRDCIEFSCDDIRRNPIMVVFRVFDETGNFNDCMVEVNVQDKVPPQIICPPDITLTCEQNAMEDTLTGIPTVIDLCYDVSLTSKVVTDELNDCNYGYIVKRWIATDSAGRSDSCDQRIDLTPLDTFDLEDIDWPDDYTVEGCELIDAHPSNLPDSIAWPGFNNTECAKPATGYDDDVFYNASGHCIKIFRNWEVIDWCQYDVNDPQAAIWTHRQTIYIDNLNGPVIDTATCMDQDICAYEDCEGEVSFDVIATDDCTPIDDLIWAYVVTDLDSNSEIDRGAGNTLSRSYPVGIYEFEFTVRDGCGNVTTCTSTVNIEDCKAPTPYCKPGVVTTIMGGSGYIDIWALDFNAGSFDNCTDTADLVYSFSADTTDISRRITCSDLSNGVLDTLELEMWVTDENNNQEYCKVVLIVQDNQDVCPDVVTLTAGIAGSINTYDGRSIKNTMVDLSMDDQPYDRDMTSDEGQYAFSTLEMLHDYMISPKGENDDYLNGVSTADLVKIQRHLLGKEEFDTPYLLIAADANNTRSVSAADISALRKLILGIYSELPDNESWRYIDSDQVLDPDQPWLEDLKETIEIGTLKEDEMNNDFIGVKIGDVTGDARVNGLEGNVTRSNEVLMLELRVERSVDGWRKWHFVVREDVVLSGLQTTIETGELVRGRMEGAGLEISKGDWYFSEERECLTLAWNADQEIEFRQGEVLFTVFSENFDQAGLDQLELSSRVTISEAYGSDLIPMEIRLEEDGKDTDPVVQGVKLYQNVPNPFDHSTTIGFDLAVDQEVEITVFDISGAVHLQVDLDGQKGYNQAVIQGKDLPRSGSYFYQLTTEDFVDVKKLILVD